MTVNDHPDVEALSAYSDGEAPEWADHVAGCPACGARLEELGAVTAAVRQPVPGPGSPAVDAAIARAMAEADEPASRRAAADEVASRRGRARALIWTAAASVAALVVAVVGTVAVLRDGDGGPAPTADQALTESVPAPPPPESATSEAATLGGNFDGALVAGELGPVDGNDALVARVEPALRDAGVLTRTTGSASASARSSEGASSPIDPPPSQRVVGTRPCEVEARERDRGLDDVVYVATASWEGEPVVVLGFTRRDPSPPTPPAVTLMVLARDGCELVSSTPL